MTLFRNCLITMMTAVSLCSQAQDGQEKKVTLRSMLYEATSPQMAMSFDMPSSNDSILSCTAVTFHLDGDGHVTDVHYMGNPPKSYTNMVGSLLRGTEGKWLIKDTAHAYIVPCIYTLPADHLRQLQHMHTGVMAKLEFSQDPAHVEMAPGQDHADDIWLLCKVSLE